MVNVVTEIIINKSADIVSAYAGNPSNASEWYVNIKKVEWKTNPPIKIGSQIAFNAEFLGKKLYYIYEITEYIPTQKLVMRTADGPFPMETTYEWIAIDKDKTKMTLRNRGNPKGFSSFMAPFMSWAMKRANNNDLVFLKKILEQSV